MMPQEIPDHILQEIGPRLLGSRPMAKKIYSHIFMMLSGYKVVRVEAGVYEWQQTE